MKIRAISLHQPWASAMAHGLKLNETRHWKTDHRGPLAIHAAKRTREIEDWEMYLRGIRGRSAAAASPWHRAILALAEAGFERFTDFPLGSIVGVTELYGCVPTRQLIAKAMPSELELSFGNYEDNRFAWLTRGMQILETPDPEKGRQGFWQWEVPADCGMNLEGFKLL